VTKVAHRQGRLISCVTFGEDLSDKYIDALRVKDTAAYDRLIDYGQCRYMGTPPSDVKYYLIRSKTLDFIVIGPMIQNELKAHADIPKRTRSWEKRLAEDIMKGIEFDGE
jgi:hypothetical protein